MPAAQHRRIHAQRARRAPRGRVAAKPVALVQGERVPTRSQLPSRQHERASGIHCDAEPGGSATQRLTPPQADALHPSQQQHLRALLCRALGSQLTPELAAAVEAAAGYRPPAPVDLSPIAAEEWGGFVIRCERFEQVLPELEPLHAQHWLETERHRHGLELRPNLGAIVAAERAGRLVQFTVRRDGALVGHLRMYLGVSLHTSTRFAEEDTVFIRSDWRGGFLAVRLLRYAERVLRQLGVREIRADSKLINNADVLMRRMGYEPVALKFIKVFKEESHVR